MDIKELTEAFLQWNIYGEGKDRGKANGNFWYRGRIMYFERSPQWRLVQGAVKDWALLWKGMGLQLKGEDPWFRKFAVVKTPDLGVFSKYDQDWIDEGEALNDRVRFIMLQRVREMALEEPIGMNAIMVNNKRSGMMTQLKAYYHEYDLYNRQVGAGWNALPEFYLERLHATFEDKVRAYNHPSAVTARERAKARKKAMEALGVATK